MSDSRESRSQARLRVRRRAFIAVPVAIAVLAAGGYFLFRGGKAVLQDLHVLPQDKTPGFEFDVKRSVAIPTTTKAGEKELNQAAKAAADDAYQPLDDLYTEAFLDPGNWKDGSYDEVWDLFDAAAAARAEQDIEILTLGTTAGDTFESVEPGTSKLSFKVLTGGNFRPNTIVAIAVFRAEAPRKDGQVTHVLSQGQFFLHDTADGWKIFSYKVIRDDEITAPAPGPSGSASPSTVSS